MSKPFLLGLVQYPGVGERTLANLLRLLLVLVHLFVAHLAELKEQVAHESAFACVHVPDDYQVYNILAACVLLVRLEQLLFVHSSHRLINPSKFES